MATKTMERECLVFHTREKGGMKREKIDVSRFNVSRCMWWLYDQILPVFYGVVDKAGEETGIATYDHVDKIGEAPFGLYDAANPVDYKEFWTRRGKWATRIFLGVAILFALAVLFLLFVMATSKTGGGIPPGTIPPLEELPQ